MGCWGFVLGKPCVHEVGMAQIPVERVSGMACE